MDSIKVFLMVEGERDHEIHEIHEPGNEEEEFLSANGREWRVSGELRALIWRGDNVQTAEYAQYTEMGGSACEVAAAFGGGALERRFEFALFPLAERQGLFIRRLSAINRAIELFGIDKA
jgi:hypothetical protein